MKSNSPHLTQENGVSLPEHITLEQLAAKLTFLAGVLELSGGKDLKTSTHKAYLFRLTVLIDLANITDMVMESTKTSFKPTGREEYLLWILGLPEEEFEQWILETWGEDMLKQHREEHSDA